MFRAFLLLALATSVALPIPAKAQQITGRDVDEIIEKFGPVLKFHPDEIYRMDDPQAMLDPGQNKGVANEIWGAFIPNTKNYNALAGDYPENRFYNKLKKLTLIDPNIDKIDFAKEFSEIWDKGENRVQDCRSSSLPYGQCKIFLNINKKLIGGKQERAKRIIELNASPSGLIYVTFWLFYPFNGPGQILLGPADAKQIESGRHYGDWEHLTIQVQKIEGQYTLTGLYMSRHDLTPWYLDMTKIDRAGTNPVVYVAINSHAHYPNGSKTGTRWVYEEKYKGIVKVYDTTKTDDQADNTFRLSEKSGRIVVRSNIPSVPAQDVGWYNFPYDWGQFMANRATFSIFKVPYIRDEVSSGPDAPIRFDGDQIAFANRASAFAFGNPNPSSRRNLEAFGLAYDLGGNCCTVQHTYLYDDRWQEWEGNFRNAPLMRAINATVLEDDVHVFGISASDNTIMHNWYSGDWRNNWLEQLPPRREVDFIESATSIEKIDNSHKHHIELFAIEATTQKLLHTYYSKKSGWKNWSERFQDAPDGIKFLTTVEFNDILVLFAITNEKRITYTYLEKGIWSRWKTLAGQISFDSLSALKMGDDSKKEYIEILAISADGDVYQTSLYTWGEGMGWSKNLTSNVKGAQQVLLKKSMHPDGKTAQDMAFAIDANGTLFSMNFTGKRWNGFNTHFLPKQPLQITNIFGAQHSNFELFTITDINTIERTWQDSKDYKTTWGPWANMLFASPETK